MEINPPGANPQHPNPATTPGANPQPTPGATPRPSFAPTPGASLLTTPLGAGHIPGAGNSPAASPLHRALPNALVAKSDELFALARKSSMWTLSFGLACCAIEMISAHMSHHDIDRFGIVTWPSPRQADVMIVAGTVVKKMADPIKLLYEQMPDPKWVIAMGSCATNGGPYYRSYSVVMGVDHLIPVDVYVPGCPPRPEALMYGLLQLQEKIRQDAAHPPTAPIASAPAYRPAAAISPVAETTPASDDAANRLIIPLTVVNPVAAPANPPTASDDDNPPASDVAIPPTSDAANQPNANQP